ncbi:MAG: DUF11 domain-containing protein [Desulfuromusa sp.]|nr:DUF11 domain-containing protein [Desulfuromusa sp.]
MTIKIRKDHSFFIFAILLLAIIFLFPKDSRALDVSIDEPMTGPTASGWVLGGSATLTGDGSVDPVGDGWLRLTNTSQSQAGYAYFDTAFAVNSGVVVTFDYATWGGTGADGYSIFLFDAATTPFQIGASGGSLGYAQKTGIPGLSGGYIGIGVDEWGNFSAATEGRIGGPGRLPNSVAVRGSEATGWPYLGGSAANVGQLWFNQATRPVQTGPEYRKVVIFLTPVAAPDYLQVDTYIQFGANQPPTQVATNIYTKESIPAQLKVGFAASTGGSTNYHEIRNLEITPFGNSSDLSTSSKSVVDINGGDVEPGDTLRYTITLNETKGVAASSIQVTDDIPANVSSFNVTSIPAVATDNSTGSGGAHGNGYLDISDISVAANGSETITFEVTVSGAIGDTIDNEAIIINSFGPGATPNTATLFITGPASGLKQLYLNAGTDLSRTLPGTPAPPEITIAKGNSFTWSQTPVLQAEVKIDPTATTPPTDFVPVDLYYFNNNKDVKINVTLACSGGGSITLPNDIKLKKSKTINLASLNIPLNSQLTCAAGNTWTLTVYNKEKKDRDLLIFPVDAGISQVALPSLDVINVDSVEFHKVAYPGVSPFTSFSAGDTVYIRSVVSDPFGYRDINGAELTLIDAAGNPVASVSPDAMTEVADSGTATKTYEYSYTIPAFQEGNWTARVESFEGTEGTISDISQATFQVVSAPQLTILKSANSPTASPGQEITYSVIITNSGGPAINVVIDDDTGSYTAWGLDSFGSGIPFSLTQLAPGPPADSGLTMGTAIYYDESDTPITPISDGGGAGAGFDSRVNRFELPMNGTMVSGGQFRLEYKVKVE